MIHTCLNELSIGRASSDNGFRNVSYSISSEVYNALSL